MPTDEGSARSHRALQRIIALLGSLLLLAAAAEVGLRWFTAPRPQPRLRPGEPVVQEPDPELGWKNKAGVYELPPYSATGHPIHMQFFEDGRRRAAPDERSGTRLIVLGGSFAQGWAISDEETLAWRLQQRFPDTRVENYGTGGYGTYQSLLVMERELTAADRGAIVLYAFTGHHTTRNVAPWNWMRMLSLMSVRGHIDVPYATLDDEGQLHRHPPERFVAWPLAGLSRLVEFLQTRFYGLRERLGAGRSQFEAPVTERILLDMQALAASRSAQFAVALLSAERPKARHVLRFLEAQQIATVDCNSFPLTRHQIVIGEGHPNGRMNEQWASCVGDFLASHFSSQLETRKVGPTAGN